MNYFGERLRELRLKKKLTQEELGNRINVTKVSVSGYENGNRTPDMDTLMKIADVLETSIDHLLGRDEKVSAARDLPGWKSEEEIQEFVAWIEENVDGTFFYDFNNTSEARKEMMAHFLTDQKQIWEMERRKKP